MDEARRFQQSGPQLVAGPLGGRVLGDVDVEDAAPSVAEDHEAVEDAEGDRRDREEVDAGSAAHVVLQEGAPCLRRRLLPPRHVLGNRGLGDGDAELEQLAVDSRRAPAGVLRGNATDERPQVGLGRGASGRARSPAPEEAEAEAVPADDGGGPQDGERVAPTGPEIREDDPEGAVEDGEPRPGPPPDEDRELLTQGEVLKNEVSAGAEHGADGGREGAQQGGHTNVGRRTDRWQQARSASPAARPSAAARVLPMRVARSSSSPTRRAPITP